MNFPTIEEFLKKGAKIHGFSSGGGVRVLSSETPKLMGYGEGATIQEAFHEIEQNFKTKKKGICYFTGGYSDSKFDHWARVQSSFDIVWDEKHEVVEIHIKWTHYDRAPRKVVDTVMKTRIPMMVTDEEGIVFEVVPMKFPGNGEPGVSSRIVSSPKGKNNDMREKTMRLGANSLDELLIVLETALPEIQF